ncbi:MAG: hypothetical protein LUF02_10350 [Erysipelotrichaceae bacterium]|nr:hypothetical protein [Erysipelotrichaceae bacterium]
MDVYIEWTYLINGLMLFWTLEILCFLLNQVVKMKTLLLYVLFYNISFILLYVDMFSGFLFVFHLMIPELQAESGIKMKKI